MSSVVFWCLLTGVLITTELLTGTFYLLMLSLSTSAGALAAWLGTSLAVQIFTAAATAILTTASWHWRRTQRAETPASHNPDVNLDIGEQVTVPVWQTDGTARIPYRGAQWTARLAAGHHPVPGTYLISAVEGNRLVLTPLPSPSVRPAASPSSVPPSDPHRHGD